MKIFAPPPGTVWRLTDEWIITLAFMRRHENQSLVYNITGILTVDEWRKETGDNTHGNGDWVKRYYAWEANKKNAADPILLPKGTVITFDRYHISHDGDHAIACRILASPELRFVNKKNGGKGKGQMRFYLRVGELNNFPEVEQVHDFKQ